MEIFVELVIKIVFLALIQRNTAASHAILKLTIISLRVLIAKRYVVMERILVIFLVMMVIQ